MHPKEVVGNGSIVDKGVILKRGRPDSFFSSKISKDKGVNRRSYCPPKYDEALAKGPWSFEWFQNFSNNKKVQNESGSLL